MPRGATRGVTALALPVLITCLPVLAPGCTSRSASVDESAFVRRLAAAQQIPPDQAACVARYVFAAYSPADIQTILDDGLTALPSPLWAEFAHASIGCMVAAEDAGRAPGADRQ